MSVKVAVIVDCETFDQGKNSGMHEDEITSSLVFGAVSEAGGCVGRTTPKVCVGTDVDPSLGSEEEV